jgi:hypothetical protein
LGSTKRLILLFACTTIEAELLRAIADAMNCPMPPIPFAACPTTV